MNDGASINDILPIYNEICILAVLSGMEIDKAKRMYAVKTGKVLHRLEKRKQEFKKTNGGKLPNFYYFIIGQEEKIEKNNTATLNCPMSIIYDFVTKYEPHRLPKRKVKLSDLFALDESDGDSNDYLPILIIKILSFSFLCNVTTKLITTHVWRVTRTYFLKGWSRPPFQKTEQPA